MTLENKKSKKILKTNYFQVGMILGVTAIVSFLIIEQNQSFAATIFTEDFSGGDLWVDQNSAQIGVNTGTEVLDWNVRRNGNNDASSRDVGAGNIPNDGWVFRTKVTVNNFVQSTVSGSDLKVLISDLPSSTAGSGLNDALGFAVDNTAVGSKFLIFTREGGSVGIVTFNTNTAVGTFYVEVIRDSPTSMSVELFSDAAFTQSIEKKTKTISANVDNLRYVWVGNPNDSSGFNGITSGTIDDIQLSTILPKCNGLTVTIEGTSGNDVIIGTPGNDVIAGLEGMDYIEGNGGDDTICGGDGDDLIRGGEGNDFIDGDGGKDLIMGDEGNDTLKGSGGDDRILGGSGADTLKGNNGQDMLSGGSEDDSLDGGNDVDICDNSEPTDTLSNCEINQ